MAWTWPLHLATLAVFRRSPPLRPAAPQDPATPAGRGGVRMATAGIPPQPGHDAADQGDGPAAGAVGDDGADARRRGQLPSGASSSPNSAPPRPTTDATPQEPRPPHPRPHRSRVPPDAGVRSAAVLRRLGRLLRRRRDHPALRRPAHERNSWNRATPTGIRWPHPINHRKLVQDGTGKHKKRGDRPHPSATQEGRGQSGVAAPRAALAGRRHRHARRHRSARRGGAAIQAQRDAGLPVTYQRGNEVVKEFPDGRREVLATIDVPEYRLPKGVAGSATALPAANDPHAEPEAAHACRAQRVREEHVVQLPAESFILSAGLLPQPRRHRPGISSGPPALPRHVGLHWTTPRWPRSWRATALPRLNGRLPTVRDNALIVGDSYQPGYFASIFSDLLRRQWMAARIVHLRDGHVPPRPRGAAEGRTAVATARTCITSARTTKRSTRSASPAGWPKADTTSPPAFATSDIDAPSRCCLGRSRRARVPTSSTIPVRNTASSPSTREALVRIGDTLPRWFVEGVLPRSRD